MSITQASFSVHGHNPDVLDCIANLSNDEVFTPPAFANQMLDTLADAWAEAQDGENIWTNPDVHFLDPFTKSGVFLREITRRLTAGLENEIPDLEKRVDHILTQQVFGIAITHLTSLLARRSLYCSKWANGEHSIARSLENEAGNVWFERLEHTWVGGTEWVYTADTRGNKVKKFANGKCFFCGASQKALDRGDDAETHAYAFIHTNNITARLDELFGADMQFDVIVGNPPYQLKDGGDGGSAVPIYHKFVEQAKTLEPRFLSMVTPARWLAGGRGLDGFRAQMLGDAHLRVLVDFIRDKDAFPNVNVNGGISYFLWDRDNSGDCTVTTVAPGGEFGPSVPRSLSEFDLFVRRNEALPILRKVIAKSSGEFSRHVSSLKPFGLRTYFHGVDEESKTANVKLYGSGKITWVSRNQLEANAGLVDRWKVFLPRATDGNENYPLPIWDQVGPFVAGPGTACSETYMIAYLAKNELEANNAVEYMRTKFFRFLVSLRKLTQDNKADNFKFVPDLKLDRAWTDKDLYWHFGISAEESDFIDQMIRTMDWRLD